MMRKRNRVPSPGHPRKLYPPAGVIPSRQQPNTELAQPTQTHPLYQKHILAGLPFILWLVMKMSTISDVLMLTSYNYIWSENITSISDILLVS